MDLIFGLVVVIAFFGWLLISEEDGNIDSDNNSCDTQAEE